MTPCLHLEVPDVVYLEGVDGADLPPRASGLEEILLDDHRVHVPEIIFFC